MRQVRLSAEYSNEVKTTLHQLGREGFLKLQEISLAIDVFGNDIEEIRKELQ